jgi:TolB protein
MAGDLQVLLLVLVAASGFVALAAPDLRAQTINWEGRIEKQEAARMPLWVERMLLVGDLGRLEPLAREGEGILVDDLELSGHFRVVGQLAADLRGPDSDIPRSKGQDILATVDGRLEESGEGLRFTGRLRDFPQGRLIGSWTYEIEGGEMRPMIHEFADQVVLLLTGEAGIARTQLACICGASNAREVFVLDYDGHGHRQATRDRSTNLSPSWSPVDDLVAYTSFKRGEADLYAVNPRTGNTYGISHYPGLDTAPAWSPDGRWLAVTLSKEGGNPDIYLIRRNGEIVKRLTFHPGIDTSPSFSPTGRQIVFMSDRMGSPQIFVMDADGLDVARIATGQTYVDSPAWSPRGDRIAYAAYVDHHFDIFVVRFDGTDEIRLTEGAGSNENPRWAPDGRHLVFSSSRDGQRAVYIMNADGTGQRRVTPSEMECFYPTWSPSPPLP